MSVTSHRPGGLKRPKTTEGATSQYLKYYEKYYRGSFDDRNRLRDLAHAKIILLRKKAPKFYEEKLANLINQASHALLTCNVGLPEGVKKFHETHEKFLRILDELGRCQPSGQVEFQIELDRLMEHDRLIADHQRLREEVSKLEAREIDLDELSDSEDCLKTYTKKLDELDKKKKELKDCAVLLAKIEGEEFEEHVEFELLPRKGSVLERLNQEQIVFLEEQLKTLGENAKNKRTVIYDQKPFIEESIKKLQLNIREYSAQDLKVLVQDTYDSYLDFYRRLEDEKRSDWHEHMLQDKYLLPREGAILKSPDDITPEMEALLKESEAKRNRAINDLRAKLGSEEISTEEEERLMKEAGSDYVSSDDDDEEDVESREVRELINKKKEIFARVKEEPRDDYDTYHLGEEDIGGQEEKSSDEIEEFDQQVKQSNGESGYAGDSTNNEYSEQDDQEFDPNAQALKNLANILDSDDEEPIISVRDNISQNSCLLSKGTKTISSLSSREQRSVETKGKLEEDEDDNMCLGLVAPKDKIECIELSDDE